MEYKLIKDKVLLQTKRDTIRVHLYLKLVQYGIKPFENDIDIILELYMFGGYSNSEEQNKFIKSCIEKKLKKSEQSVRNTLSKYVSNGVFEKPKNTVLTLSDKFLPKIKFDKLILEHIVSHAE